LTGVEKPVTVNMNVNNKDSDAIEAQRMMDMFFGNSSGAAGHVVVGEVVKREDG
jgi:hypothetical protein